MKKVLLTGASGFIGSHLVKHLQKSGFETVAISSRSLEIQDCSIFLGSLNDPNFLSETLQKLSPDFVIHLAGKVSPGRDVSDLMTQDLETVQPALNLAKAIPSSVKLSVFFGSCEEYGNAEPPFRESQMPVAFSPYGWAKISAYFGVSFIARQRKIPLCWVRPFLAFGPGQNQDLLMPTLIRGCMENRVVPLTKGEQTREFVYVNDICEMVLMILKNSEKAAGEIVNLCHGEERNVRSVAETVQKIIGSGKLDFGALPYRENEAMRFFGSPEKFHSLFGIPQKTDFEKALRETIG